MNSLQTSTPRLLFIAVLSTLLLMLGTTHVPVAAAEGAGVDVGSTTVISSEGGVTGILLRTPQGTTLPEDALTVELGPDTTAGRAMLRQPDVISFCDFCFLHAFAYRDAFYDDGGLGSSATYSGASGGCNDAETGLPVNCSFGGGVHELYLVSDGPMEAVLDLGTGTDVVSVSTTAHVDGIFKSLRTECLTQACVIRYAGETHDIGGDGRLGYASITTWEAREGGGFQDLAPGVGFTQGCAYPGYGVEDASADPEAHPRGCDEVRADLDSTPRLVPAVDVNGGYRDHGASSFEASGPQYLGVQIRQATAVTEGKFGAWGVWLTEGISCPSGHWSGC